jgi:hypothetical protein
VFDNKFINIIFQFKLINRWLPVSLLLSLLECFIVYFIYAFSSLCSLYLISLC